MAVSKVLSAAEQKYSQIEREALTIVWSVKKLTKFLLHKKFTLITDHKPLLYILNKTIKSNKCDYSVTTTTMGTNSDGFLFQYQIFPI